MTSIQSWTSTTTPTTIDSARTSIQLTKLLVYKFLFCFYFWLILAFKIKNLLELLNSSIPGKNLLESYSTEKVLSKANRNSLTAIICEFWMNSSYQPISNDYMNAANQIQKVFPNETEVFSK